MFFRAFILTASFVVLGYVAADNVLAQGTWLVERTHSEVTIDEDGQVEIEETIRVEYGDNQISGFDRVFPLKYTIDSDVSFASVDIESVQRNGVDEPYALHEENELTQLSIGDERLTLSGAQEYRIVYKVNGALRRHGDVDLFYWKTVGGWDHEVVQATTTVLLPKEGLHHHYCEVYNSRGQLEEDGCESVALAGKTGKYASSNRIEAGGSMLVAAEIESGVLPISTVTPPTVADWIEVYRNPLLVLSSMSALCLLLAGGLWMKGERLRRSKRSGTED